MINSIYLELTKATINAAIESSKMIGLGDNMGADRVAVNAMRSTISAIDASVKVVIGEGERDKAPMLYRGEVLGIGNECIDIAVDPLEGTNLCAEGRNGAISVLAAGESGSFLEADDIYMYKAIFKCQTNHKLYNDKYSSILPPDSSLEVIIAFIANNKNKPIKDISVCILKRKRHQSLIKRVRNMGAKIIMIDDGDVLGAIMAVTENSGIDLYIGIGGAPEGVIAASAVRGLGGLMFAKMLYTSDGDTPFEIAEKENSPYITLNDIILKNGSAFIATAVTDTIFLNGVRSLQDHITTESLIIDSDSGYQYKISIKHTIQR